ncbi:Insect cuticle protein, partial [Trinorchestia longiramus]
MQRRNQSHSSPVSLGHRTLDAWPSLDRFGVPTSNRAWMLEFPVRRGPELSICQVVQAAPARWCRQHQPGGAGSTSQVVQAAPARWCRQHQTGGAGNTSQVGAGSISQVVQAAPARWYRQHQPGGTNKDREADYLQLQSTRNHLSTHHNMAALRTSAAAVALLTATVSCASVPSFRFSYQNPENNVGIAQFYRGPDSAFIYNWGYQYPGQAHSESKDNDGNVQGSYAFVDANGEVQQASYQASPGVGFTVDQKVVAQPSGLTFEAPAAVVPFGVESELQVHSSSARNFDEGNIQQFRQNFFNNLAGDEVGLDIGSAQAIERASPTLLAAVRAGALTPAGGGPEELVFRVSDALVDEARGSVSALAALLDADPVAARHDQQVIMAARHDQQVIMAARHDQQ